MISFNEDVWNYSVCSAEACAQPNCNCTQNYPPENNLQLNLTLKCEEKTGSAQLQSYIVVEKLTDAFLQCYGQHSIYLINISSLLSYQVSVSHLLFIAVLILF